MKITINDVPLECAGGNSGRVISAEQYAKLTEIGAAFRANASNECFSLSREIEAVKIEAAYINGSSEITAVKFRLAFYPWQGFGEHLSAKTINLSALWEISHNRLCYAGEDTPSDNNFSRVRCDQLKLQTNSSGEVAKRLLEALAKTVEKVADTLDCESKYLTEVADRIRRVNESE